MLLALFMRKVLDDHPDDVVAYAGRFFDRPDLKAVVEDFKAEDDAIPEDSQ